MTTFCRWRKSYARSAKIMRQSLVMVAISVLLLNLFTPVGVDGLTWLSLGISGASSNFKHLTPKECQTLKVLSRRQVKLCRKNIEHMDSVRVGAQLAMSECRHQFRKRRWNCTGINPMTIYGNGLIEGTREAAFIHALSASSIAHSVTVECSKGHLDKCGCDRSVRQRGDASRGFRWSGCSDNAHYGAAFSRTFIDLYERRRDQPRDQMLMNLHNNEAGRNVLLGNMKTECKCHGVSGSCEMRTCWRRQLPFRHSLDDYASSGIGLSRFGSVCEEEIEEQTHTHSHRHSGYLEGDLEGDFRQIGRLLKRKFDGATEVHLVRRLDSHGRRLAPAAGPKRRQGERKRDKARSRRAVLVPSNPYYKQHDIDDLVYLKRSPDYCQVNTTTGLAPTTGRECNVTSRAIDGCDLLCCARGYSTQRKTVHQRCHCKFEWCCEVKCKTCITEKYVHTCL